jgi:hypothetical protein
MKTIHRTNGDTIGISAFDAGFCNNVRHFLLLMLSFGILYHGKITTRIYQKPFALSIIPRVVYGYFTAVITGDQTAGD